MTENPDNVIYSRNVIEFVALVNEFCNFLEKCGQYEAEAVKAYLQRILPLIYVRAMLLPTLEPLEEEENEKFVTEEDYHYVASLLKEKLGAQDDFLEVFDPRMQESEYPVPQSISENLADMYQELKDCITLYRLSDINTMNDAIWECKSNFINQWGQTLVNTIRAVHAVAYDESGQESQNAFPEDLESGLETLDTSHWLLSKKIEDFRRNDQSV